MSGLSKLWSKETKAGDRLPYGRLVNGRTVELRDGSLMQMLHLEGYAFETADTEDLNYRHTVRDVMLRGIANSRFVLHHHIIRRPIDPTLVGEFADPVCADIDDVWQQRMSSRRLFVNDLFLTLTRRPAKGKVGLIERSTRWFGVVGSQADLAAALLKDMRELETAVDTLLASLAPYGPRVLDTYVHGERIYSEPMEFLSTLYNGELRPVLAPNSDIGHYLPYKRVNFGADTIEFKGGSSSTTQFGAILSVKEYPAATTPGMTDGLMRLPHPMVLSESFAFVERQTANEKIDLAVRRFKAADDDTITLRQGLMNAKDDVASGKTSFGDHHMTVMVKADSLEGLDQAVADAQAALTDIGAIAVREDIAMEPAFWAQFPGNEQYIARKALVSTANFAGLASMHNFAIGRAEGNHWGPAITVLETTASTPYFFNFHHGDLGNFTLIGPSGTGKTVVLTFLLAQAQKLKPRTVYFDKDRGAEIFVRAIGGHYDVLRPGRPTGFNPLQLPDTPANRAFLTNFIGQLLTPPGGHLNAEDARVISDAVDGNFDQEPEYRQLRYFQELLAGHSRPSAGDLAWRLSPWVGRGERAWLFDNAVDTVDTRTRTLGFDMTALLDDAVARTPAMMYLFHRVDERLDGDPTIIVIDEGWKVLDDAVFAARLRDWMKTIRKRNGIVGFCTQSARDALDSRISTAIIEQSATQIFMPNPKAQAADYCEGFGLTAHELDLVRALPDTSRCFLIKHANHSVVARLDLSGMPDVLTLLSGRESTIRTLDDLRAIVGDKPDAWLEQLLRRGGPEADLPPVAAALGARATPYKVIKAAS
jgi:type IV secretion system protein VirB4